MDATSTRRFSPAGLFRVAGVILALLMVCGVVIQRSESAFTATTNATNNTIAAGQVNLTNDKSTGAYSVALDGLLKPGSTITKCIEVTYTGMTSGLSAVALYGSYSDSTDANTTDDSALAPYLTTTVDVGTSCTGFSSTAQLYSGTLKGLTDTYNSYATAKTTAWTPSTASEKRAFQITMTLQDNNAAQGLIAEPKFSWEIRTA